MTKRDAPRTAFGNGFSPFGSEVFRKSRFALYSLRPISRQPNHGLSACTRSYGGHARNGSKLRFGRKRFAHQIARETADNDVLAQLGDLGFDKRSEEHTSELQSLRHLVCRLLLEKKKQ